MARRKVRKKTTRVKNRSKFPKSLKKMFQKGGKLLTQKRRRELPARYFLLPKQRKYPYVNPNTGKPSVYLLTAAYRRAKQYHRNDIAAKAARLLKRYFGITPGERRRRR